MKTISRLATLSILALAIFVLIAGCKKDKEDPVPVFTISADTVTLVGGGPGLQFFATCTNNGVTMSAATITTPQDSLYACNLNNTSYAQNARIPLQANNTAYPKRIGTWNFNLVGKSSGGNSFSADATYAVSKQHMAGIETIYSGELRTEATHLLSGTKLSTDAPPDNNGRGEFFSPTDLVATALGSCMVTIMGIAARTHGFNIDGTRISITKVMSSESPRRIAEIIIDLAFPSDYSDKVKKIIEYSAKNCPVALSLHPGIRQTVSLHYG